MSTSIMIIDDSAKQRQLIVHALRKFDVSGRYIEAENGLKGFKTLLRTPVDLIICDLVMPQTDGFQFMSLINARPELKDIPLIILTSCHNSDSKLRGFGLGANDYVTKPFDPGELAARARKQLEIRKRQNELKKTNESLEQLSYTDHLTGLFNRRYLIKSLDGEINRTKRSKQSLSLILLDIDSFKKINDTYGHQNGDIVLIAISNKIQEGLRSYVTVARYGGDEFVIVLPTTPSSGALVVAERMREAVQATSFAPPMENLKVTLSLGIATYPSEKVTDVDSLLRRADEAMYCTKQKGGNRVRGLSG